MSRRTILLCAALVLVAVAGVGTVVVVTSADQSSGGDQILAVSRRHEPPAGSLQRDLARAAAAGRIQVGDHTGKTRGWIPYTAGGGPDFASYPKGVIPVSNDRGEIVGYELPYVGFVERSVVESPNFNVDKYVTRHGL